MEKLEPKNLSGLTPEQRAKLIAAEANECCNRSDGYQEDIEALALAHIRAAIAEKLEGEKPWGKPLWQSWQGPIDLREKLAAENSRAADPLWFWLDDGAVIPTLGQWLERLAQSQKAVGFGFSDAELREMEYPSR